MSPSWMLAGGAESLRTVHALDSSLVRATAYKSAERGKEKKIKSLTQVSFLFHTANYVEIIEHAHHAEAAPVPHEEEHYAHAQESHPEPAASHHVEEVLSSKPTAVALYDYNAGEPNEISFSEGDIIVEIDVSFVISFSFVMIALVPRLICYFVIA